MKLKASVIVSQYDNPRYDTRNPGNEDEYLYLVEKAVNTLAVNVDDKLDRARLAGLMQKGISVTIVRPK